MSDHAEGVSSTLKGSVRSLQVYPGRRQSPTFLTSVEAIADAGLAGNHKTKLGAKRQVLLIEGETLDALGLAAGDLRENITTDGLNLHLLGAGSEIALGRGVVLQISEYCPPCRRVGELRGGLLKELAGRRGMLARVLAGGDVAVGDALVVQRTVPPKRRVLPG